jgi:G3E family GTPase
MSAPLPVLLITGYLGAGKTTLINRLLARPEVAGASPALIINEYGPVSIDARLLASGAAAKYEINRGSLFCACTKPQLIAALRGIAARPGVGLVIIESTGIAETRNLETALAPPELTAAYRIRANLCVVDALNFVKVAPYLPILTEQVRWADAILLSKTDLAPAAENERLGEILRGINADAPQHFVCHGEAPAEALRDVRHRPRAGALHPAPPADIAAVAVRTPRTVDAERFRALLGRLGPRLLRLKGNVTWTGGATRYVEFIAGALTEKEECEALYPRTAFTVIAWKTPSAELQAAFEGTLAE